MSTTINKFQPINALKALKAVTSYIKTADVCLSAKYDDLFKANVRHTDFVLSTSNFDRVQWDAAKVLVRQSFVNDEMRRVALLSKADYKTELATLTGANAKAFQALRDASTSKVGSKMRDFANAMLVRDTAKEQARVAKESEKAKKARDANKAKAETDEKAAKTMKEKIIVQLTNTVAIMQGDDKPEGFDFVALQGTITEALAIMSIKLTK